MVCGLQAHLYLTMFSVSSVVKLIQSVTNMEKKYVYPELYQTESINTEPEKSNMDRSVLSLFHEVEPH